MSPLPPAFMFLLVFFTRGGGVIRYSPSGNVTAAFVYANYGKPEDFDALETLGVSIEGKIVITRYGKKGHPSFSLFLFLRVIPLTLFNIPVVLRMQPMV